MPLLCLTVPYTVSEQYNAVKISQSQVSSGKEKKIVRFRTTRTSYIPLAIDIIYRSDRNYEVTTN